MNILGTGLAALGLLLSSGCGGGGTANVITVNISSSSGTNLILGQSTTLTAVVSGATNPNVNWTPVCNYTTTTVDSTGKSTTKPAATCPRDTTVTPQDDNHTIFGVFSNQQATGTEVFTATSTLPDPKTYPGLVIIATAQSAQNTAKTGTIKLTIDSGISLSFTPGTASVPINEPQTFQAQLTNDTGKTTGVTWSLTQQVPDSTTGSVPNPYTPLATCSPACGTLTDPKANPVKYTAPSAVPTAITPAQKNNTTPPANVTLVAVSNADPTRFTIGTITITPGGPITFNNISPLFAPQGATLWDIYLDAPNISSSSQILLTYPNSSQPVVKDSNSGQIKVLFPIPSSSSSSSSTSTTCSATTPCSTGARLRLLASDLSSVKCAGLQQCSVSVSVVDPAEQCNSLAIGTPCPATGTDTFTIQPVRATSTASVPDDIVQGSQTQPFTVTLDGGYFGPNGNSAAVFFQSTSNTTLAVNPSLSTSQQLITSLDPTQINPTNPGLYQLFVRSNGSPAPSPNNPSVTNMALFPDYSTTKGVLPKGATAIPAGTNPSAVDIDPALGVLVVAETGSNTVEFFNVGSGTLTSVQQVANTVAAPINVPTGVSVDRNNHTVAVVNYGTQAAATSTAPCQPTGQSVTVLGIPGGPNASTAFSVPLPFDPQASPSNALQGSSLCPAPMPYSLGVDSDSHLALVAYSSNSVSSLDNLGFIVNLNPDSSTSPPNECLLDHAFNPSSTKQGQCLFAQVTLNTGVYPQIAVAPHGHLGLVTPGGSGVVRGVDVTKASTANVVASASLAAGLVTVTIDPSHCPPPLADPNTSATPPTNPCPFSMVPGAAGSVLITGLKPNSAANGSLFNGVFTVNVTSNVSFTYVVNSTASDSATGGCQTTNGTKTCATVFYGQPDQIFGLPSTTQGVAINSITSTAAIADANATGTNGPQIDLLNGLDQSVSSISFFANCTAFTNPCLSSPELLATTNVAWQPYTNAVVSYNPKQGLVSISDPVGHKRYGLVSGLGPSALSFPVTNGIPNGAITLWGGIAVDPATDQAFVVESGQAANPNVTPPIPATPGQIEIINLTGATSIKPTHVSEVIVPSPTGAQGAVGGVPNALVPQATLTCTPTSTNTCDVPGVQIFGSGFDSGTQVLLDGVSIPSGNVKVISSRELTVTIPGSLSGVSLLAAPHHYALTAANGSGVQSNAVDFIVIGQVDLSGVCTNSSGSPTNTQPSSVAIADQIANTFSPLALVSVTGCNAIVQIDLNPANSTFGQQIGKPISVGTSPQGIAIWQRKGLAVVANNGSNTASVIDLTQSPPGPALCAASSSSGSGTVPCADVSTGTNPAGVAINEATGAAIIANTGSNTVTMINLGSLFPQSGASLPTSLTPVSIGGIQVPTAVAIDPDRGASNQGIAVVSAVQLSSGSAPTGALAVVEIGTAVPALSTTISSGFVSSTPTGVVFDPAVVTNTTNPGVFFANSSGTNSITEFNPDVGGGSSVSVGVNPTSLAVNPQTGAMLTANSASNTVSIVDTLSSPFKTRQTLGIPGSPTFGVAIDQFTNLAVIVDQANMRVLLFPMPN